MNHGKLTLNVGDFRLDNRFIEIGLNIRIPVTVNVVEIGNSFLKYSSPYINIDFDTVLKIKSIMETLNKKDDPRSNLLYSLKPYLRETRQKKLDQYVNLFKITEVTNLFKNDKGDGN